MTEYYDQYISDPSIVLPRHAFLFMAQTLEHRLCSSYDNILAWLRSVDEALQVVRYHDTQLRQETRSYFQLESSSSHSHDSTHIASTLASYSEEISLTDTSITESCTSTDSSSVDNVDNYDHYIGLSSSSCSLGASDQDGITHTWDIFPSQSYLCS